MSVGWVEIVLLGLGLLVAGFRVLEPAYRHRRIVSALAALFILSAVLTGHESILRQALSHQTADIVVLVTARTIGTAWWLVAAWLLATVLETILQRMIFPSAGQPRARKLFTDLLSALIYLLAFFGIATFVFGQPLTGFVATSGVLAIVLGLASQSTLSDLFSGLALNIELPFRAGDWITVAGEADGQVIEINWRATRIRTRSGDLMIIPNSLMTKLRVTNHYPPSRGHVSTIKLELDGDVDPDAVIPALETAALLPRVWRSPSPRAVVRRFGDAGVVYELYFTIDDFALAVDIESAVLRSVWESLDKAGIRGAVSRREVRILSAGERAKQEAAIGKAKAAS